MRARAAIALSALTLLASPARAQEVNTMPPPSGAPNRYCAPATVSVNPGVIALGVKKVTVAYACARVGDFITVVPEAASTITVGAILNGTGEVLTNGVVTLTFTTPIVLGVSIGAMNVRLQGFGY